MYLSLYSIVTLIVNKRKKDLVNEFVIVMIWSTVWIYYVNGDTTLNKIGQ